MPQRREFDGVPEEGQQHRRRVPGVWQRRHREPACVLATRKQIGDRVHGVVVELVEATDDDPEAVGVEFGFEGVERLRRLEVVGVEHSRRAGQETLGRGPEYGCAARARFPRDRDPASGAHVPGNVVAALTPRRASADEAGKGGGGGSSDACVSGRAAVDEVNSEDRDIGVAVLVDG
ncbi:Uncharacterised protein [Mycobacteroides abscessus subsp. abscessus]|nr:Uncharacterised protein [Mycobacteroides abscessus subsp. abscessus]